MADNTFKTKKDFLDSLYVYKIVHGDTKPITVVSLAEHLGSWHIPDNEFAGFIHKYTEMTFDDNLTFHFAEQHCKDKQDLDLIRIDIDIDGKPTELFENKRLYNTDLVEKVIIAFKTAIERFLNVSYPAAKYYAILEEKEGYTERSNGRLKDGFHIYFPMVVAEKETRYKIFDTAQTLLLEAGVFKEKIEAGADIKQIVDSSVIGRNGWMLYGSSKNPNRKPYVCTQKFYLSKRESRIIKTTPIDSDDPGVSKQLVQTLSIHFRKESEVVPFKNEKIRQEILNWYTENFREDKEQQYQQNVVFDMISNDELFTQRYNKIRDLCECLSQKRLTVFEDWRRVGHLLWCLDQRYLPIWIAVSKKIPEKFEEGACEKMWEQGFIHHVYSEGTLHFWAKEDNPVLYQEIMSSTIGAIFKAEFDDRTELMNISEKTSLQMSIRMDDEPVARLIHHLLSNEYLCSDKSKHIWYKFSKTDHRWVRISEGIELRERVATYVVDLMKDHEKDNMTYNVSMLNRKNILEGQMAMIKDETIEGKGEEGPLLEEISKLKTMITSHKVYSNYVKNTRRALQSGPSKDRILGELSDKFYNGTFESELRDSKTNIVCFKNGVMDLDTGIFRDGEPEDYITLSMGCKYIPYNPETEESKGLNKFLSEVLVDEPVRKYFIEIISTCLSGEQKIQRLPIAYGSGANGKSKITNLLEKTMGMYATTIQPEVVTGNGHKGNGQTATPETAKIQGRRLVTIKEISDRTHFRMDIMKRLTGGDKISARDVYEKSREFTPQCLILVVTNHLPRVSDSTDEAAWRRIREILFKSRFKDKEQIEQLKKKDPENAKYLFEIDYELEGKVNKWIEAFAGLLVDTYKNLKANNFRIVEPEAVVEETRRYMIESDIYHEFLSDQIEETANVTDYIELSRLFTEFKEWFKTDYPGDKLSVTKGEFITYLRSTLDDDRKIRGQRLFGYKLKRQINQAEIEVEA